MDRSSSEPIDDPAAPPVVVPVDVAYEAPRIVSLGTLRTLTRGGTDVPDDGAGGAGAMGGLSF